MTSAASVRPAQIPNWKAAASTDSFWPEFRRRILSAVQECNCIAGEKIWNVAEPQSDKGKMLEISGEDSTSPRVELALDVRGSRLSCAFSSARRTQRWRFKLLPDCVLRKQGKTYRMADAVEAVLDHLVPA